MYCRKCGTEIPKHAKFCRRCGTAVPESRAERTAVRYGPAAAAFLSVMLILVVCLVKFTSQSPRDSAAAEEMTAAVKESLTAEDSMYAQAARQQAEEILAGADEDGVISYPVLRQTAEAAISEICAPDEVTITVEKTHRHGKQTTADITVLSRDIDSVMENFLSEIAADGEGESSGEILSLLMKKAENGALDRYVTSRVKIAAEETAQTIEVSGRVVVKENGGTYSVVSADEDICRAVNGMQTADTGTSIRTAEDDRGSFADIWDGIDPRTWIGRTQAPDSGDLTGYPYCAL